MTRIFFSCDAHGSVPVLRKMTKAHEAYKCDVVMMCGDLTGKALAPIIEEKTGQWWSSPHGRVEKYRNESELERAQKAFEKRGFYWFITTPQELEELQNDKERVQGLFDDLMVQRMKDWIQLIEDTVPPEIKVIVSPGNDDHKEIDDLIIASERTVYPIHKVVDIDDRHPMISCEWVNTTPWKNTPRECPEDELEEKLEREFSRVSDCSNLICNFHDPPFGTRLDLAPKLDEKLQVKIRFGVPPMENVGSKSIRKMIEKYSPLLTLHGHIHESSGTEYIGRTLCVNPGSVYTQGMLNAFVIDLPEDPGGKIGALNVSA